MKNITFHIKVIFVTVFITFTSAAIAQPEGNGSPAANDVPIDGGLSILLAAGVAYGAKKGYDKRKKEKKERATDV